MVTSIIDLKAYSVFLFQNYDNKEKDWITILTNATIEQINQAYDKLMYLTCVDYVQFTNRFVDLIKEIDKDIVCKLIQ